MRMTINKKIFAAGMPIVIIIILLQVVAYLAFADITRRVEDISRDSQMEKQVAQTRLLLEQVLMPPNDYLINGEAKERVKFDELASKLEKSIGVLEKMNLTAQEANAVRAIRQSWTGIKPDAIQLMLVPNPVGNTEAAAMMEKMDAKSDQAADSIEQLSKIQEERVQAEQQTARAYQQTMIRIFIVSNIVLLILLMGAAWYVSKRIARPLRVTAGLIAELGQSHGDLTQRVQVTTRDEIADIAHAANSLMENLQGMIRDISLVAEKLQSGTAAVAQNCKKVQTSTDQVANSITDVAEGSSQQAGELQSLASQVKTLGAVVESLTALNQAVAAQERETRNQVARSGELLEQVEAAMNDIRDKSGRASLSITQLDSMSGEINRIVEVIDNIARQTALLALNAAIEAARAGEQGRGFAVVADEVRHLAEQSQDSARDISQLIGKIQAEIGGTVTITAENAAAADKGREMSAAIHQAIAGIEAAVTKIGGQLTHVGEDVARLETASGAAISVSQNISAISQENAAMAQEVSALTEQQMAAIVDVTAETGHIAAEADALKKLVGRFTY